MINLSVNFVFDIQNSHICVRIPFAFEPSSKLTNYNDLSEKHMMVLTLIRDNPFINREQISKACGLRTTRIQQILNDLKKSEKIERIGSKKGGYWSIK